MSKRPITGMIAAIAVAIGTTVAVAAPSDAAPVIPRTTTWAIAFSDTNPWSTPEGAYWPGENVALICWKDGSWYAGTNRWFATRGAAFDMSGDGHIVSIDAGMVSANLISPQTTVGHCWF